ncbi:MAG: hypothetical protein AAGF30_16180 [Pseudomonadota bacterium]
MPSRNRTPLYVSIGLWGIGTRGMAMAFVWISLLGAAGISLYFSEPLGLILLFAAAWYWLAVKWMDANDGWAGRSAAENGSR